jgi:hypothetical protein
MKPYPSVEDLLRLVLRVDMPRVRRRTGGAHGVCGWNWYLRPFRVQHPLEGRSTFRALDTALRAELRPG